MKFKIIFLLLCNCMILLVPAMPQGTGLDPALEARIARVEHAAAQFDNKSTDLDLQMKDFRLENSAYNRGIIGSIIVLALAVAGGWAAIYKSLKAKAEQRLQEKLDKDITPRFVAIEAQVTTDLAQLDAKTAASMQQFTDTVQRRLDHEIPAQVQDRLVAVFADQLQQNKSLVAEMIDTHDRVNVYKREKRLLALCNDADDCIKMKSLLGEFLGYRHVDAKVAAGYQRYEGYEVILFDHETRTKTYDVFTDSVLQDFLRRDFGRQVFLFFGPNMPPLDTQTATVAFANSRYTLNARLLEVLDYQALEARQAAKK